MDRDIVELMDRIKERPDDEAAVSGAVEVLYESGGIEAVADTFEKAFLSLTPEKRHKYIWKWLHSIMNVLSERQENPLLKGALKGIAAERLFKRGSDINELVNLYLEGFLDSGAEDLLEKALEIIRGANQPDLEEKILKTLILITGEHARKTGYQTALSALVNKRAEGIEELKQMLDQTENPEVKSQLLFKIGQAILKKEITSKEGEEALLRSFELNHRNSEAGWAIAGLYTHLERYKELEEFLTYWLGFADDAGTKCEILIKLGRIWEEIFSNPKKATAHYQMALELNPRERGALSRLINLFSGTGKWNNVVEILERGLRNAQDREEENIYLEELGTVLFEKLNDINAAEKYFRRLRSQDPRNRKALTFYENYYSEKSDYQKLFSTLSFMLTTAEDNIEKVRVSLKMAEISEHKLHNLDRAIEAYRRVLLIDPDNKQAEDALVVLLEKTKKWHTLVEFYNERIRRLPAEQKEEKVAYLFKIIDIYQDTDKLPMEEMVFHTYSRIVDISPNNTIALNSLAKSLEERKRWSELLSVLQKKVAITEDPVELLDLFHQIANIMIEQMSNETQAIPFLEKILELDPQNADISKKLKEIYRRKHNTEKLFEMNLKELEKVEGAEKEALLFELGTFAMEKLFKYEEALGYFEELYSLNPSNRKALAMIQNLYVRLGSWERYAAFLERHIPQEREQKSRLELMERLGNLYLDKLQDMEKAKEVFRNIIKFYPDNSYAFGVLEKIYIREEDYPSLKELFSIRSDLRGYCTLLQNELAKTGEKDKQVSLYMELSSVYSDLLGDKSKGMRFLESAVRAAPERWDLGERVISHYKEKGEREKVRDLLKITVPHIRDMTEKILNLEELYNIEVALNNPSGAFETLLDLVKFDLSRNSIDRLPEAVALAEKTGQFNFFASELSKELDGYYSADVLKVLIKTIAEIYREKLFFYDDALALYKRLLDLDPADRDALDFLEMIALHKRDYNELEAVYLHRIDLAKTGAESVAVYKKLAQLYEEILNDDDKAAQCFGEILRLEEWDKEAFNGLRQCLGRLGHYFELFDLLNNAVAFENDPGEKKSLMLEAARISSSRLKDHETAANILISLLEMDNADREAADLLFAIFRLGITSEPLIEALRGHYKGTGRWQDLINLNMILLDGISDSEKLPLLYENAVIYHEKLGDAGEAFETFRELFTLNPADEDLLERFISTADATGRHKEAAEALDRFVGVLDDTEVITLDDISVENRIAIKLARIYDGNLKRPDLAIKCYEKVLPFEMENIELLKNMERLYEEQGMYEPFVGIVLREAELSWELDRRKALLLKAASIQEDILNNRGEAIINYKQALSLDETDTAIYEKLQSAYEKEGLWEELKNLLIKKTSLYSDDKDISNMEFQTGVIYRDRLGDRRSAASYFLRAFRRSQENRAALEALEDILFDKTGRAADIGKDILSFVEKYYEERGDFVKLLSVYRIQKEMLHDPAAVKEMNLKIAELLESKINDKKGAFMTLCEAISENPQDTGLIVRAEEVARELGMIREFAQSLLDASRNQPITIEIVLLKKTSDLYLTTLQDYETALSITERLIEIEPNDINTLKTLNTLYARLHRNPERVPVLETIASLVHDMSERRELYYEMAELCQQLGDEETAVKGYSYVVDHRPDDTVIDDLSHKSIERLLKLHENAGNYWHLIQVLRILGEFSKEDSQVKEAYIRIAGIYDTKLDRPDEAMKVYEILHKKFPAEIEIIKDLKLYLYRLSEWERLEAVLRDELAASPPDGKIKVLTELCDNYISRLGSLDSAFRILEEIITLEPSSEYAWENLKSFIHRHEYAEKAGELLKASCIRRGDFGKAVEVLKMLRELPHLKLKSAEYDVELANIFEERLNDPFSALEIVERLFVENPSDEMFDHYVALLKKCGKIAELPPGMEMAAARMKDPNRRIALRLKAAEALCSSGLHKKGVEVLRSNLGDRRNDEQTLDFLERIFNETSDMKGVVELLEIRYELASKAEDKIALLYDIAGIYHRELGDAERAEEFYRKILELDPIDEGAYRSLENICRERGDEQGITSLLEKELKALEGQSQSNEETLNRIDTLRMRLAYIYCEDPGTFENAFGIVKKVLEERGTGEELIPLMERIWNGGKGLFEAVYPLIDIYKKSGQHENLHRVYSEGINASLDIDLKRDFLSEAEKLAEKLGDKKSLMEHRKALLNLDPSDEKLYSLLLDAAKNEEEYLDLASFFSGLFRECREDETRLKIGKLLGNLYAQKLAQPEIAADYYRLVFLRDSGDLETREALISIYIATQKWFDLALLYEHLSEIVTQNSEKLLYLFKASEIYGEKLSDTEKRAEINQKVLEIDPANSTAISELENYYRETGDYKNLIGILRKRFDFSEGEAVKGILIEIADIYSERLQEYDKAASALKEALDIDPGFKQAVEKLEHIYAMQKDFEELAKFYGIRLSYAAGIAEKVELLVKISQLNEFYLNNPEGAEKSLKEIIALDDCNIYALTRLDELYTSRKDYENLLEILKLRLNTAANRLEELSFLIRIGSVSQKLSKFKDALDIYRKILSIEPHNEEAVSALEELLKVSEISADVSDILRDIYEKSRDFEALNRILRYQSALKKEPGEKINLLVKIAENLNDCLASPHEAILALGEALQIDPLNEEVLEKIKDLAAESGQSGTAASILKETAVHIDKPEKAARMFFDAGLLFEKARDYASASESLRNVLNIKPDHMEALSILTKIYSVEERYDELATVLSMRIDFEDREKKRELRNMLADIMIRKLGDPESGLDLLKQNLDVNSADKETIQRIFELRKNPVVGLRAIDLLKPILEERGEFEMLYTLLMTETGFVSDNSRLKEIYLTLGDIMSERLGRLDEACSNYGHALLLSPSDPVIVERLKGVCVKLGKMRIFTDYLKEALPLVRHRDEREILLKAIGTTALESLKDLTLAEESFRELNEISPGNPAVLDTLEKIYENGGKLKELYDILERKKNLPLPTEEKKRIIARLLQIAEFRGTTERTAEMLEEIVSIDPADIASLRRLRDIYGSRGDKKREIFTLKRIADLSPDSAEKVEALIKAAELTASDKKGLKDAARLLEEGLWIDPENGVILARLSTFYEELQDYEKLQDSLVRLERCMEKPGDKLAILKKIAAISEYNLDNIEDAVRYLKMALEIEGGDVEILNELIRIFFKVERWRDLIDALEKRARASAGRQESVDFLVKAAELSLKRLEDGVLAERLLRNAIEINSSHTGAALLLARILDNEMRHDEALELYGRVMKTGDPQAKVEALIGRGKILLKSDPEQARVLLTEATKIDPENETALAILREIYSSQGYWQDLIGVLKGELKKEKEASKKAKIAFEIAHCYLNKLSDENAFLEWIRNSQSFKQDDPDITKALVDYYISKGDVASVVTQMEWLVNYFEGKKKFRELPSYAFKLGLVFVESGDTEKAVQYLKTAHEHDPYNVAISLELGRQYVKMNEFLKALRIYQPLLLKLEEIEVKYRIEVLYNLALVYFMEGEKQKALQYVQRVISIDPQHAEAAGLRKKIG